MECSDSTTHLTNKHVQYPWIGKNRFIFWQIHRLKVLFFWLPIFLRKKKFFNIDWLIKTDIATRNNENSAKKILGLELFCFVIFLSKKKKQNNKNHHSFSCYYSPQLSFRQRERERLSSSSSSSSSSWSLSTDFSLLFCYLVCFSSTV